MPKEFAYLRDVAPDIVQDMRYFGEHNFLGRRVTGYQAGECILTRRAALRLKQVQERLRPKGLALKVYDCYRPTQAVAEFVAWAEDLGDRRTKAEFYPTIPKSELFERKYIAKRSRHSRGSTVDLAIVPVPTPGEPPFDPDGPLFACHEPHGVRWADNSLDFGTGYDCFHELSHTANPGVSAAAKQNRQLLVEEMARAGFQNYKREWWHFELKDEPFRKTYFDFPIVARAIDALPAPKPRYRVVCTNKEAGVPVHSGPSIGHEVTARLPHDAWGFLAANCDGEVTLAEWRTLDAVGRKGVRPPWCQVRVPGPDAQSPLVEGWVNGRFLMPVSDQVPDCS